MDPLQSSQNAYNTTAQYTAARAEQQESASALRNTSTDSKALEAMRDENKKSDAHAAQLKTIQGEADRNTLTTDTMNAIHAAQQASATKKIGSDAGIAKSIQY